MLTVRASRLPLALVCAQSLAEVEPRVESEDDGARLGSAFHAVMAGRIKANAPVDGDVPFIAAEWGVSSDLLQPMVGWAWKAWREKLADQFPDPRVEVPLCGRDADDAVGRADILLTGHPDVFSVVGTELRGLDWKTGYEDTESEDQFKAYSWMAMRFELQFQKVEVARFTKLRVRDQRAETYLWTRQELDRWWEWAKERLQDQSYRPSAGCIYCPRAHTCDARTLSLRSGLQWMMALDGLGAIDDDQLAQIVAAAKGFDKLIKGILAAAKMEVEIRGHPIPGLNLVEQNNREIDAQRGWDVLLKYLGEAKLRELCGVGVGDAEKAVKALAPKGDKGAAVERLMKELNEAGALSFKTVKRLECSYHAAKQIAGPSAGSNEE